ncbi:MAG: hypothetical protein PHH13_02000 [Candidatus Peribacteraceae bacterium]|nr:hypothetical protein [Candidatus Peribacteraceae bacterium]
MPTYAAVLGHQPAISLAELASVLPDFSHTETFENVAVFETASELDQAFLDSLGGTVILARQITEAPVTLQDIPQLLGNELATVHRKAVFSLRGVGVPRGMLRTLFKSCKQMLRSKGVACRYVGNEFKPAVPVLLRDAGLLDSKHGCELVLLQKEETLWVGRTLAAQDVDAYTKRDMDKPVRDTTVGLLPPKLAQVLLNFAVSLIRDLKGAPSEQEAPKRKKKEIFTIYDPFCGTGVIPLESLHRGWPILASDVSIKAVNGCSKNIEWLRKEEKIFKKDTDSTVWKQDATQPFELKELPDAVVTEGSLGPAFTDRAPIKEVSKLRNENERMQAAFLENAAKTLPGVPIVCIWPVWKQREGWVRLEKVWDALGKMGYQASLPPGIEPEIPGRVSLFYRRPDQFIGREIVLLKPRKKK